MPDEVYEHMAVVGERGEQLEREWQERFEAWSKAFPEARGGWDADRRREPREGWLEALPVFEPGEELATRSARNKVMHAPTMVGGAADLSESTYTEFAGRGRLPRRTPVATSLSASASTRWGRSSTASRSSRRY